MTYTISDFRRDVRQPYAWPGGYPRYFVLADGGAIAFSTLRGPDGRFVRREMLEALARNERSDQWRPVGCEVNWEDNNLRCDHTGAVIESAYGDEA